MMSPTTAARWFKRMMWLGIFANLALALPTIAAPGLLIDMAGLPTATPELWPRFAGLLLVLLSIFYTPAATDIDRYRVVCWFALLSRLAGVLFFAVEGPPYLLFGLFDLVFLVPQGILLLIAVRGTPAAVAGARAV
jgi:hypothetical protein